VWLVACGVCGCPAFRREVKCHSCVCLGQRKDPRPLFPSLPCLCSRSTGASIECFLKCLNLCALYCSLFVKLGGFVPSFRAIWKLLRLHCVHRGREIGEECCTFTSVRGAPFTNTIS
jgi:hypothetical protein